MGQAHIKLVGLINVPKLYDVYDVYETSKIVVMEKSFKHENFKCFPRTLLWSSLYDHLLEHDGTTLNSLDPFS